MNYISISSSQPFHRRPENQDEKNLILCEKKVELGRTLFFDRSLSGDGTVSCATCHDPASAFAARDVVAVGVHEQKGTRNAPTLLNSVFRKSSF